MTLHEKLIAALNCERIDETIEYIAERFVYGTYPCMLGHEFSAEIIDIPKNDGGLEKGMIVTDNPFSQRGKCYSCQRGLLTAV